MKDNNTSTELRIDLFTINFVKMQEIYENTMRAKAEAEALFDQAEKCSNWQCHHPRFFKDGTPAVTKSGQPDKRGTCGKAMYFLDAAQQRQYTYAYTDLSEFFDVIGVTENV